MYKQFDNTQNQIFACQLLRWHSINMQLLKTISPNTIIELKLSNPYVHEKELKTEPYTKTKLS